MPQFLVRITHDENDKEELLRLTPTVGTAHTDTSIEYWIEVNDYRPTVLRILDNMREDFRNAGKE